MWAHCGRIAGAQQAFVKERMTEGKLTAKKQEEEMPRQGAQKGTVRRALWAMWTARKNFGACKYQQSRKTQARYTGKKGMTHLQETKEPEFGGGTKVHGRPRAQWKEKLSLGS